jgi:hypothetical protein
VTRLPSEISLGDKVLLAALKCSQGDLKKFFTAEALLVAAWETDNHAFGLRGFEDKYPDSNKLYTKIDGRDGLVAKGLLRAEGERTLQITEAGLGHALTLSRDISSEQSESGLEFKVDRALQESMTRMLNSREFQTWLTDKTKLQRFRDVGSFWGIAPGTPARTVRERISRIDQTLTAARQRLEELGVEHVIEKRGRELFDRDDIERLAQFQAEMKKRFQKDLRILDPEGDY